MDPVREFLKQRGAAEHVVEGGLAGLVQTWESVVESVKRGYNFGLDDYLNDMDARQLLDEALAVAPSEQVYIDRVRRADEAMRRLVKPIGRSLWAEENTADRGWTAAKNWWYFAVPVNAGPDLSGDLKEKD